MWLRHIYSERESQIKNFSVPGVSVIRVRGLERNRLGCR
jgi:hypothetical protein